VALSEQLIGRVAAGIAALTCVGLYLEARGVTFGRARRLLAGLLMALSVATYFHYFELPVGGFYHRWEMFHYFLGSKYARELGYERLYLCSALADAETGNRARVEHRRMRDLRNDAIVPARTALSDPEQCRSHFSAERFREFKLDVAFFRGQVSARTWANMQVDHGYNPAPAWTLTGRALASLAPASERFMRTLSLIDPLLMVATLTVLGWAFGSRVLFLATVFWCTQAPSAYYWTGGAFLRQDWLFLCVLAAALLRKRYYAWAGAALSWAALLRVFPALLFGGPFIVIAWQLFRSRRLRKAHRSFLLGALIAAACSLGVTLATFGPRYHAEFAEHIAMHASTPVSNHMSLRTLFSIGPGALQSSNEDPNAVDPTERWATARRAHFARFRVAYWLCAAGIFGLFALALRRMQTLWLALGLSLVLIVAFTDPSSYYYSIWIVAAPLALARRVLALPFVGLAAASQLIALQIKWTDIEFAAMAGLYVGFSLLLLCAFRQPTRARLASCSSSTDTNERQQGTKGGIDR
jgi:hypothetical protein